MQPKRKLSKAQQRAIEDAARRRAEAIARAQAAERMSTGAQPVNPPGSDVPAPALTTPAEGVPAALPALAPPTQSVDERGRLSALWLRCEHPLAVLAVVVAVCSTIGMGAPVLGHPLRPLPLVLGVVVVLALLWAAGKSRGRLGRWSALATYASAVVLIASFAIGSVTSVVVDGRVYAFTSDTAKAHRITMQMRADLLRMAELDKLLSYEQGQARAHYSQYDPASRELTDILLRYTPKGQDCVDVACKGGLDVDELPSAQFVVIADQIRNAAYYEYRAMQLKRKLLDVDDAALDAQAKSFRATFIETVLQVSPELASVAEQYGISLTGEADGPVE